MGCCQTQNKNRSHTFNQTSQIKIAPVEKDASNVNDKANNSIYKEPNKIELAIKNGDIDELRSYYNNNEITKDTKLGMNMCILHYAVLKSNESGIIELILNKGSNIDEQETETGNTALFFASVDLKENIVGLLLKHNPDIDHKNNNGDDIFKFLEKVWEIKRDNNRIIEDNNYDSNEQVEVLDGEENNIKKNNTQSNKNNSNNSINNIGYNKKDEDIQKRNEVTPEEMESYQNILGMLEEYRDKNKKK